MGRHKGVFYVGIRQLIRAKGAAFEEDFLKRLHPKTRNIYLYALPVSWVESYDVPEEESPLYLAAKMLFPNKPNPFRCLGKSIAINDIRGIYKVFFHFTTSDYVVKKMAALWKQYNDTGDAAVENQINTGKTKKFDFVIRNNLEMNNTLRQYLAGYLEGLIELTGKCCIKISTDIPFTPAGGWRWQIEVTY